MMKKQEKQKKNEDWDIKQMKRKNANWDAQVFPKTLSRLKIIEATKGDIGQVP